MNTPDRSFHPPHRPHLATALRGGVRARQHRQGRRTGIPGHIGGEQAPVRPGSHRGQRPALPHRRAARHPHQPARACCTTHARCCSAWTRCRASSREYADGVRGHVRVHANISAIVQFLPEDLGTFIRAHEQIKIDLEEHLSNEVLRAVHEGAADLGICHTGAAGQATDLQTLPLPPGPARPGGTPRPPAGRAQGARLRRHAWTGTTWACTPTAPSTSPCTPRRQRSAKASGCASA